MKEYKLNPETFAQDIGVVFIKELAGFANTSETAKEEYQIILKYLQEQGVPADDPLGHEGEKVLRDTWISYSSAKEPSNIPQEVRGVFDRMLGKDKNKNTSKAKNVKNITKSQPSKHRCRVDSSKVSQHSKFVRWRMWAFKLPLPAKIIILCVSAILLILLVTGVVPSIYEDWLNDRYWRANQIEDAWYVWGFATLIEGFLAWTMFVESKSEYLKEEK